MLCLQSLMLLPKRWIVSLLASGIANHIASKGEQASYDPSSLYYEDDNSLSIRLREDFENTVYFLGWSKNDSHSVARIGDEDYFIYAKFVGEANILVRGLYYFTPGSLFVVKGSGFQICNNFSSRGIVLVIHQLRVVPQACVSPAAFAKPKPALETSQIGKALLDHLEKKSRLSSAIKSQIPGQKEPAHDSQSLQMAGHTGGGESQSQFLTQVSFNDAVPTTRQPLTEVGNFLAGSNSLLNLLKPNRSLEHNRTVPDASSVAVFDPKPAARVVSSQQADTTELKSQENLPPDSSDTLECVPVAQPVEVQRTRYVPSKYIASERVQYLYEPRNQDLSKNTMVPLLDRLRSLRVRDRNGDQLINLTWSSRISKAQTKLLEMDEAWQPPLVGKTFRQGTVPLEILTKLTSQADAEAEEKNRKVSVNVLEECKREIFGEEEAVTNANTVGKSSKVLNGDLKAQLDTEHSEIDDEDTQHPSEDGWPASESSSQDVRPRLPPDSPVDRAEVSRKPSGFVITDQDNESRILAASGYKNNSFTPEVAVAHNKKPSLYSVQVQHTTEETVNKREHSQNAVRSSVPCSDVSNSSCKTPDRPENVVSASFSAGLLDKAINTNSKHRNPALWKRLLTNVDCLAEQPFTLPDVYADKSDAATTENKLTASPHQSTAPIPSPGADNRMRIISKMTSGKVSRVSDWVASQTPSIVDLNVSSVPPSSQTRNMQGLRDLEGVSQINKRQFSDSGEQHSPLAIKRRKTESLSTLDKLQSNEVKMNEIEVSKRCRDRSTAGVAGERMPQPWTRNDMDPAYRAIDERKNRKRREFSLSHTKTPLTKNNCNSSPIGVKQVRDEASVTDTVSKSKSDRSDVSARPDLVNTPSTAASMHRSKAYKPQSHSAGRLFLLERFQKAYPLYNGAAKQFMAACRVLKRMQATPSKLHPALFDDFVYRHHHEYVPYLKSVIEEGESAMSYETWYFERVDAPQHLSRVVRQPDLDSLDTTEFEPMSEGSVPTRVAGEASPELGSSEPDKPAEDVIPMELDHKCQSATSSRKHPILSKTAFADFARHYARLPGEFEIASQNRLVNIFAW